MNEPLPADSNVGTITKVFDYVFSAMPDGLKMFLAVLAVVIFVVFLLAMFYLVIAKPIINFIAESKARDRHRVKEVSAFAWGNPLLRAPLVSIGTDIYAFGQSSMHGKTIRYIKAASVYIPVVWCIFALTLLIVQSGQPSVALNWYVLAAPIALVAATIFILDVSIITAQKSRRAKVVRILIALTTGYIFSAIPLDYIYKSDVDSYLLANDSQLREATAPIKNQISEIEKKTWYQDYLREVSALSGISEQLEKERLGEGVTGKPNQSDKRNRMYEQIMFEYNMKREDLNNISQSHASELVLLQNLNARLSGAAQGIAAANPTNHIKRHLALWSYALSSIGTAIFFLCCFILFWSVDSLAVLVSFLDESEYLENVRVHNERRAAVFASPEFLEKFKPVIAGNTP
jgi:hypothetical protein